MSHQNLFEALQRVCDFTALETDMQEIIDAVEKDKAEQIINGNSNKTTSPQPCNHTFKAIYIGVGYVSQCTKCGLTKQ